MDHPSDMKGTPLDPTLYALGTESLTFFKTITGIHDDDELKEHILSVQAQAYAVCAHSHSTCFDQACFSGGPLPLYPFLQLHKVWLSSYQAGDHFSCTCSCTCKAQDIQSARLQGRFETGSRTRRSFAP